MGEFDFLVGSWNVLNRRLTKRLAGSDDWVEFTAPAKSWSLFEGNANVDEIVFPDGVRGLTLRLFDPVARKWSLNWSSSDVGRLFPPVIGEFTDGRGVFYGEDTEGETPVRVRFIWSDVTENSARWEQAFSIDDGESWEVNWIMTFTRS
ncbi:hypothetical protein DMH03_32275 [Amycolatopsis sp. WAC 01376]|uniref:hypothetical protein n=1 Tax=Amycolatopsis sp. WAC 01376 TaxID=2203195 RepID=UPI000F77C79B|nr:hypothetical protein [Amycolatopsis sp. WAC 01376]RSM56184.1 hypothetical protein DMH03_32275 [Amycolatopsis sp. WAC 01376]